MHLGGGLVLLKALVQGLGPSLKDALIDERARGEVPLDAGARVQYVPRSMLARWTGLMSLAGRTERGDVLFCFNSLPPLRKPPARVVNYVHAPYIVGGDPQVRYPWPTALRQVIERAWFRAGVGNCDEVWVQTSSMARAMRQAYPRAAVHVVPFVDDALAQALAAPGAAELAVRQRGANESQAFFYPADGVAHKNHSNLLKAWALLAAERRAPRLLLTLRPDEMQAAIAAAGVSQAQLPFVENLGRLPRPEVLERMRASAALIFPSRAETLGLPMLEARSLGVPILASDRDFVRDVCDPVQSFDPNSPESIASAVRRFLQGQRAVAAKCPPQKYYCAADLVDRLLAPPT